MAPNGTVFLDEVGEMSMRMQVVLLRFLETGEIQRIGADRSHGRVNVRLITATNRDLQAHIASGEFREDLFFRLNVMHLHLPPLRERTEDIPLLFDYYLQSYSEAHRVEESEVSPDVMDALLAYRWPGNIRELKNVVERMVVKTRGRPMTHGDVPSNLVQSAAVSPVLPIDHKAERGGIRGSPGQEARVVDARRGRVVLVGRAPAVHVARHDPLRPQKDRPDGLGVHKRQLPDDGAPVQHGRTRTTSGFSASFASTTATCPSSDSARCRRGSGETIDRRRQVVALSLICPCQLHPLRCRRRRGQPGWDSACCLVVTTGCGLLGAPSAHLVSEIGWATAGIWLKADTHVHTRFSDGSQTVQEIVNRAASNGCDVLAITDHADHNLEAATPAYAEAIRQARIEHPELVVLAGLEWNVPPYDGDEHATVLVAPGDDEWRTLAEFKVRFDDFEREEHLSTLADDALQWLGEPARRELRPVVFLNHPSRRRDNNQSIVDDIVQWRTNADLIIGISGAPGHQRGVPLGAYGGTLNLIDRWDPAVATVGGAWDQLLQQGLDVWGGTGPIRCPWSRLRGRAGLLAM